MKSLTVALDLRHPHAYLALHPTAELGAELGIGIDWLPLRSHTLTPPQPARADEDRGTRHRRLRAEARVREVAVYAEARGLVLRDIHRAGDSEAAHLAWWWLRERHPVRIFDFLDALFRDYWGGDLDAASLDAMTARIGALGADPDAFRDWSEQEGPGALAAHEAALHEAGIFLTPAYRLEDELFLGREHLPMLRWILQGRRGPAPI